MTTPDTGALGRSRLVDPPTRILFEEKQRFRQPWLLGINLGIAVACVGLASWALIQQLVFRVPFGNNAASDPALVFFAGILVFVGVGIAWIFYASELETVVREDGLFVRFRPFHRKPRRLGPDGLLKWEARTYRPIREYGGWGLRWGFSGRAYNVSGNQGVQLEYLNADRILIGSRRAPELAAAIEEMMRLQRPQQQPQGGAPGPR